METSDEIYDNDGTVTPETRGGKPRKRKSTVWEHFTIEDAGPGCRMACCKGCKRRFSYSNGFKVLGTSHLRRHIYNGTCPARLHLQGNNQLSPYTLENVTQRRQYQTSSTPYIPFDQDRCHREIAKMIIMHDYPLHMVECPGFVSFVQSLQPQFEMVNFNTVQGDCVATYLAEKQNVMKYLEGIPGRFGLTLDIWTSKQTLAYVFVTGHFIDGDWKLQKKLLNVVVEPFPESDAALSRAVASCIANWNLDGKMFSVTSNHPASKEAIENLRILLSAKNPNIFNGQLLIGNCIARLFSNLAKDVFLKGADVIEKIRDSVKHVKTSESPEETFQVHTERTPLSLDDQTQWNTTYLMLVAASESKEVFSCLGTAPSAEDWKRAETLCTFLKPLYDAVSTLESNVNPHAVNCFHEIRKTHSDLSRAIAREEDPCIGDLVKTMIVKIEKYLKDSSLVLAMAVVMDPRYKMKLVEFSFSKLFREDARKNIKAVDDRLHELFNGYLALPQPLTLAYAEGESSLNPDGLADFDVYIMETMGRNLKSELDRYLDETLLPRHVKEFNVLEWWKHNKLRYPTLSGMARDILSIPMSAAADFGNVFDIESREMDAYKTLLRPETVEALICAKDWFQSQSQPPKLQCQNRTIRDY
ncbi:PREDICTED: zinc finger BED domain-containing protein DAYSLEEPER-like [Tarenaya hassleriana]|uniref:zinc finger BED domain-containing protein DAYSLEEPER-like n=1 Tax=Tarenaya hassleriana TaxID=28532 RepID=UPI00053C38C4|nr:PREDICTED: zinc finger BED domain-containing protein DAYSLEEPER-like [Tarenaya hassleriana]